MPKPIISWHAPVFPSPSSDPPLLLCLPWAQPTLKLTTAINWAATAIMAKRQRIQVAKIASQYLIKPFLVDDRLPFLHERRTPRHKFNFKMLTFLVSFFNSRAGQVLLRLFSFFGVTFCFSPNHPNQLNHWNSFSYILLPALIITPKWRFTAYVAEVLVNSNF